MMDMTTSELQEAFEAAKADNDRMRANLRTKEQTNETIKNEIAKLKAALDAETAKADKLERSLKEEQAKRNLADEKLQDSLRRIQDLLAERDAYRKVVKWLCKSMGGEKA